LPLNDPGENRAGPSAGPGGSQYLTNGIALDVQLQTAAKKMKRRTYIQQRFFCSNIRQLEFFNAGNESVVAVDELSGFRY
jgi:hypothetical protein